MFPRRLARINRAATNPVLRLPAGWLPPFALVRHRGRRSGRTYDTPVFAFRRADELVIVLSYGARSDWVRNVLADGGAVVRRAGRSIRMVDPRVVPMADRGPLSALGRFSCRFADDVIIFRRAADDTY
jgi:deazaflavin-dependent oxidoreductase (nitroreductase family)